ncbi:MAG: hypothetical protein LBC63_08505 [Holophagales bacterium]|jgi:hypothetical protein|nr:hypothetical protein [Holophagales bacterium]
MPRHADVLARVSQEPDVLNGTDAALRAPGRPFFDAEATGQGAPPAPATQATAPENATWEAGPKAGAPPPEALAKALRKIIDIPPQRAEMDKATHVRGLKLDPKTMEEMRRFIEKRGMAKWVRKGVQFVLDNKVTTEWVAVEAAELKEKRRGAGSETTTVALNDRQLKAVQAMGKKNGLSDQEVLEGCAGLYLKAHLVAREQQTHGRLSE